MTIMKNATRSARVSHRSEPNAAHTSHPALQRKIDASPHQVEQAQKIEALHASPRSVTQHQVISEITAASPANQRFWGSQTKSDVAQRASVEEEPLQAKQAVTQLVGSGEEEPLQAKIVVAQRAGIEEEEPLQAKAEVTQRVSEEEEPLQAKMAVAQRAGIEEEEPLQAKQAMPERIAGEEEEAPVQARARSDQPLNETTVDSASPAAHALPGQLQQGIESLSGVAMGDVRVHYNSPQPAQLRAHAYAQGKDIHVAPGQEQHLPHEAWHVVQQAQGRVKPTAQLKGAEPLNDEAALEREADVMGAKALQHKADAQSLSVVPTTGVAQLKGDSFFSRWGKSGLNKGEAVGDAVGGMVGGIAGGTVGALGGALTPGSSVASGASTGASWGSRLLGGLVGGITGGVGALLGGVAGGIADAGSWFGGKIASGAKSAWWHTFGQGGKFARIVKAVQSDEGAVQKTHQFIEGDTAVNTYFADEIKTDDPTKKAAINKEAKDELSSSYKKHVMPDGNSLDEGAIESKKAESKTMTSDSNAKLAEAGTSRSIVEMYYNQLESLKAKDTPDAEKSAEAGQLFSYAAKHQEKVAGIKKDQDKAQNKLETEGRIAGWGGRTARAVGSAIVGAVASIATLGIGRAKANIDARGMASKREYKLDASGKATKKDVGRFTLGTAVGEFRDVVGEFKAKIAARQGMGRGAQGFSGTALVLEVFKRGVGIVRDVLSSASIWLSGLCAVAPVLAPAAAACGTLAYYLSMLGTGLTALRLLFNSMAQISNNNPALFREMAGETTTSAGVLAGESLAFGADIGFKAARESATGIDTFNSKSIYDPKAMMEQSTNLATHGHSLTKDTAKWFGDKGVLLSGVIGTAIAGKVPAKGLEDGDNSRKYAPNGSNAAGSSLGKYVPTDAYERKLITDSYQTTRDKAERQGAKVNEQLATILGQETPAVNLGSEANATTEDREGASQVEETTSSTKDMAQAMKAEIEVASQ